MQNNKGFTLIEILVAITIFSIMMISVFKIFLIASDLTYKSDINREMQINLKNVSETIAEDIRKNGIFMVTKTSSIPDNCELFNSGSVGNKLCILNLGPKEAYYLGEYNGSIWERKDETYCSQIVNTTTNLRVNCSIVKGVNPSTAQPLTNSFVGVKSLKFYLSEEPIKKVMMQIIMRPSTKKGIRPEIIKESEIIFQTTISERFFLKSK